MHLEAAGMSGFAVAAVACGMFILALIRIAPRVGWVDRPGGRKAHQHATPLVGGLAIYASMVATLGMAGLSSSAACFAMACGIVLAAGAWDDASETTAERAYGPPPPPRRPVPVQPSDLHELADLDAMPTIACFDDDL